MKFSADIQERFANGAQDAGLTYCAWVQTLKTIAPSNPKARAYFQVEAKLFQVACHPTPDGSFMTAPTFVGLPPLPKNEKAMVERMIFAPRAHQALGHARDAGVISYRDYQEANSASVQTDEIFAPEAVLSQVDLPEGYLAAWSAFAGQVAAYYLP